MKIQKDQELFTDTFKAAYQSLNDQKLEFFAYYSLNDMKNANKSKIFHGEGPFLIKFKATPLYVR